MRGNNLSWISYKSRTVNDTNYEDIFGFLDRLLEEYSNILNVFYNPNSNTGRTYLELFGYNNKLIWKAEY